MIKLDTTKAFDQLYRSKMAPALEAARVAPEVALGLMRQTTGAKVTPCYCLGPLVQRWCDQIFCVDIDGVSGVVLEWMCLDFRVLWLCAASFLAWLICVYPSVGPVSCVCAGCFFFFLTAGCSFLHFVLSRPSFERGVSLGAFSEVSQMAIQTRLVVSCCQYSAGYFLLTSCEHARCSQPAGADRFSLL